MTGLLWAHVRWLAAEVRWLTKTLGYWIRPYDMLADARRWRWQPRQRCGWSYARGGVIRGPSDPSDDRIPFMLSPGRVITDPDEAGALGLTADARRMREAGPPPDWQVRSYEALLGINEPDPGHPSGERS